MESQAFLRNVTSVRHLHDRTAVTTKVQVPTDMTLCKLIVTDVSEELLASIFRVAQLVNRGCKPFHKVDKFLPVYKSSYY